MLILTCWWSDYLKIVERITLFIVYDQVSCLSLLFLLHVSLVRDGESWELCFKLSRKEKVCFWARSFLVQGQIVFISIPAYSFSSYSWQSFLLKSGVTFYVIQRYGHFFWLLLDYEFICWVSQCSFSSGSFCIVMLFPFNCLL